ncbi:recQ-mediated genome instability protein 2 [Betta splendens]|uniref:RecQ-mediated genome instability protein 2 n=1 Tax=Betta splendens TaxID=158456 RepID=A0A6P7NBR2_BETSP|nr:recQ-mediated genome instability protein 2 [Betta splendens]
MSGQEKRPPPLKALSGQLRPADGGGFVVKAGRGRALAASLVWMQGTVLDVQLDRDAVQLLDDSGTFAVRGVNSVPKGRPCLCRGKYVMVMGVIQAASPEPAIRAVKMADLSDLSALHRRMWKLEVDDLQQVMA